MKEIDKATRRRLVYAKWLHMHAQEHLSSGTEFDRMLAAHHFDNVAELLLKCVAAEYEIPLGDSVRLSFEKLWEKTSKAYEQRFGSELPRKTEFFKLNRIRGDVQHWGDARFSLEYIKDFDEYTYDLMNKILSSVFGLGYSELFMSSLVNDAKIRELLKEAEEFLADEKWKEAIAKISVAFALAKIRALRRRHLHAMPRTLGQLGLGSENLDERVGILALGLDIEDYKRFIDNTPAVPFLSLGEQGIQWIRELSLTKENTLFCLNFVLDAVVRWGL